MHRFGRSTQEKTMDRWGGGFILAAILLVAFAWLGGGKFGTWFGGGNSAGSNGNQAGGTGNGQSAAVVTEAKEFQMHLVRVGIFRSKANYMKAVTDMETGGYPAMLGPMESGATPVYAGPFMSAEAAQAAVSKIQGAKADYKTAFPKTVTVAYNPGAMPAAAIGAKESNLKKGVDAMNMYLHQIAILMENKLNQATADTAPIMTQGKLLDDLAKQLSSSADAREKELAVIAAKASAHAGAIAAVADAKLTEPAYQTAVTDYMNLVSQYNTFQAGK